MLLIFQTTLESLNQAHKLIERHVCSNNILNGEVADLKTRLENAMHKYNTLKTNHDDVQKDLATETEAYSTALAKCNKLVSQSTI